MKVVGDFFVSETGDFQKWLVDEIRSFGHHVQPLQGDGQYPGIPDLSIAMVGLDVWAEVKLWRKAFTDIHIKIKDAQKGEHELTAQQRKWLLDRQIHSNGACGVLIAWRSGHNIRYISFIPIDVWDEFQEYSLATLVLSRHTAVLDWVFSGKTTLQRIISGSVSKHVAPARDEVKVFY